MNTQDQVVFIDKEECIDCKRCEANCMLVQYLGFDSIEEAPLESCNLCGHCIAACKNAAITHAVLKTDQILPAGDIPTSEEMLNLIRVRRSFRTYKEKPISREDMEKLTEAVRYSMTGRNAQEINVVVVESQEVREKIAAALMDFKDPLSKLVFDPEQAAAVEQQFGKDTVDYLKVTLQHHHVQEAARKEKGHDYATYHAPAIMLLTGTTAEYISQVDAVLAAQAVALLAPTLGISACYNGILIAAYGAGFPPLMEALQGALPEGEAVFAALMLGYEKFRYRSVPPRKERRVMYL